MIPVVEISLLCVGIVCFRPLSHAIRMELRIVSYLSIIHIFGCLLLTPYFGYLGTRTGVFFSVTASFSPIPCTFDYQTKSVSCTKRGLEAVPEYLSNDIRVLNLSLNSLDTLRNNSFQRYTALTELDLSYNNISFIETAAFYHLGRLHCLNISENIHLNGFKSEMFRWFGNLVHLELNYCNITSFPHDTLKWMPNLEQLHLEGNPINSINITSCPNKTMQWVTLAETSFEKVTAETFSFPCECLRFDFQLIGHHVVDPDVIAKWPFNTVSIGPIVNNYDFVETMEVYRHFFMGFSGSVVERLSVFNFDGRASGTLEELKYKSLSMFALIFPKNIGQNQSFFGSLPYVGELFVLDLDIPVLYPKYFQGMGGLVKLHLIENGIAIIDALASQWPVNLQLLDLSGNDLLSFDAKSLYGLNRLSHLYLSNNRRLTTLSLSLLNLQLLDISETAIIKCETLYTPNLVYFVFNSRLPNEYDHQRLF